MDLATFERLLTPAGQRVLARAEELHDAGVDALRSGEQVRRLALEESGDAPPGAAADLAATVRLAGLEAEVSEVPGLEGEIAAREAEQWLPGLRARLADRLADSVTIEISTVRTDPWDFVVGAEPPAGPGGMS